MRALTTTFLTWIKSIPWTTAFRTIPSSLLSLASKIAPIILVPAGFVAGALKSIAGSFLGGGFLRVLVNPYTIMFIAFGGSLGWAYHKGKQHERINQAKAIIALNNDLKSWKKAYEEADEVAEKRLQIALQNWQKQQQGGKPTIVSAACKLPPNAVNAINDIAGD